MADATGEGMLSETLNLHKQIQQHDAQLSTLNTRMGHVETKLDSHDGKLDRIINAVSRQEAAPKFEPRAVVSIVKDLAVLFAMVCTGIIYLAVQSGRADIVLLQDHDQRNEGRLSKIESLILPDSWTGKVSHR